MKHSRNRRVRSPRRGMIVILVCASLVVILGVAALSVDGGRIYAERMHARAAADAAAFAAANELYNAAVSGSPDGRQQAILAARALALDNGYADSSNSHVEVNIPPRSGEHAYADGYVEVIVRSEKVRSFSGIFGSDGIPIVARSVAAGRFQPTEASVLVLDPKSKNTLKLKKGGTLLETAGDVIVNTKNKKAAELGPGAEVIADNLIFSASLDKKVVKMLQRNATGEVHQNADPTPNPFADLPPPPDLPTRKLDDYRTSEGGRDVYRLPPGEYHEKLKFDKDDLVYMQPGTYVLEGGLSVKGDAVLQANGTTLCFTKKRYVRIESSSVTLSPPQSGPYRGISLYLDPAKKGKVSFKKDGNLDISGIIYAPNSDVSFKKTDLDLEGFADDWDGDADEGDDLADASDGGANGQIHASIICRRLNVDKSHLRVLGKAIAARMPDLRIVE